MTFSGFLRAIYTSRKPNTKEYLKWITKIIFGAQFGTPEQQAEIIITCFNKGVFHKEVLSLFGEALKQMTVVYLIYIGKVKELQGKLDFGTSLDKYKDDESVFMYGKSDSFDTRLSEYNTMFKNYKLLRIAVVNKVDLEEAEDHLELKLNKMGLLIDYTLMSPPKTKTVEIFITHEKNLNKIYKLYTEVSGSYGDKFSKQLDELYNRIDKQKETYELKISNQGYKHTIDLKDKELEVKDIIRDNEIKYKDLLKDNEIKYKDVIRDKDIKINELTIKLNCLSLHVDENILKKLELQ